MTVPTFSSRSSSTLATTRWGLRVTTTARVGKTSAVKSTRRLRASVTVKRPATTSPRPSWSIGTSRSQAGAGTTTSFELVQGGEGLEQLAIEADAGAIGEELVLRVVDHGQDAQLAALLHLVEIGREGERRRGQRREQGGEDGLRAGHDGIVRPSAREGQPENAAAYDAPMRTGVPPRAGTVAAAAAFFLWGLFPLYWKMLAAVPALEVVAHRTAWGFVAMAAWVTLRHRWTDARAIASRPGNGRAARRQRRPHRAQLAALHLGRRPRPRGRGEPRLLHQPARQRAARRPGAAGAPLPGAVARGGPRRGGGGRPHRAARPPALDRARARGHVRPLRPRAQDRRRRRGRRAALGDGAPGARSRRDGSCRSRPGGPGPSARPTRAPPRSSSSEAR